MLKTFNPLPAISTGYYFQMAPKKKNTSNSANEILAAQREFARSVSNQIGKYTQHQIQMLINNNPPEDATDVMADYLLREFTRLHYLFLFSLNSEEDSLVLADYSSGYTSLHNQFVMVKRSCKKTKVKYLDICSQVMQHMPEYVLSGREKKGIYPWENGLSELAIELRRKYAKELPDENHINVMNEHFAQYDIKC